MTTPARSYRQIKFSTSRSASAPNSLPGASADALSICADCTPKAGSWATSVLSATRAPTLPSSRSRVLPRKRMPNSTSERCVRMQGHLEDIYLKRGNSVLPSFTRQSGRSRAQKSVSSGGECRLSSSGVPRLPDIFLPLQTCHQATRIVRCRQVEVPLQPPPSRVRCQRPRRMSSPRFRAALGV